VRVEHSVGWSTQLVTVTNNCSRAVDFYVDREAGNGNCRHVLASQVEKERWTKRDSYHGTYNCG
jgi:hypothetical protein